MTTTARTEKFLTMMGPPLRRAIRQRYNPDSCVASSSIGLDVLGRLGYEARPISVRTMLANRQFVERLRREGHVPQNAAERERWFIESGCHAIGLGVPDPTDTETNPIVNGLHVALLVENAWLWDLSIDQASRPAHGLVITEPFVGHVGMSRNYKKWLRGKSDILFEAPGQGIVVYQLKPDDRRYEQHPNWVMTSRDVLARQEIATEAISALRGLFELSRASGELFT
jgi:hypothetical protein